MTLEDARQLVLTHGIELPPSIVAHLQTEAARAPQPDDVRFRANQTRVIASAGLSLEAAAAEAVRQGIPAVILSDVIEGEARDIGAMHGAIAREVATRNRPFAAPVLILSGGETTVTLRGRGGRGGRNTEFLLSFARSIAGLGNICALGRRYRRYRRIGK